jgi:hypothetical protein
MAITASLPGVIALPSRRGWPEMERARSNAGPYTMQTQESHRQPNRQAHSPLAASPADSTIAAHPSATCRPHAPDVQCRCNWATQQSCHQGPSGISRWAAEPGWVSSGPLLDDVVTPIFSAAHDAAAVVGHSRVMANGDTIPPQQNYTCAFTKSSRYTIVVVERCDCSAISCIITIVVVILYMCILEAGFYTMVVAYLYDRNGAPYISSLVYNIVVAVYALSSALFTPKLTSY